MSGYFYLDSSFTPKVKISEVLNHIKDNGLSIDDYVSEYNGKLTICVDEEVSEADTLVDDWTGLVKEFADWAKQDTVQVTERNEDQNENVVWYLGPGRSVLKAEITEIEEEIERLERRLVKKKALFKKAGLDIQASGDAERESAVVG